MSVFCTVGLEYRTVRYCTTNRSLQKNLPLRTDRMTTYRLDIEYDGESWHGWQKQPDCQTIQGAIEQALEVSLREPVGIVGSGRTDAGVHARGQVAHFQLTREIDVHELVGSLNGLVPTSIAIRDCRKTEPSFHARYDAVRRHYRYHISDLPVAIDVNHVWTTRPAPDFELMNRSSEALIGEHDFSAFCKAGSDVTNRICTIYTACWQPGAGSGTWIFDIVANRFLRGMVRAIVGTLLEIGRGRRDPDSIPNLLESLDRTQAGMAVPARGLVLEAVEYPDPGQAS